MKSYPSYLSSQSVDIASAIREGIYPMIVHYDWTHDGLPFFGNHVGQEGLINTHHSSYSMSHVPGRWLNALLNAQQVLSLEIDEKCIRALRRWTYRSYESFSIGFPVGLNLKTFMPEAALDLHNLRESMHALYALVAFRDDDRAFSHAKTLIDSVDMYFDDATCEFRYASFYERTGAVERYYADLAHPSGKLLHYLGVQPNNASRPGIPLFARTFGRYIGPLVKLYRSTGYAPALIQATRLKDACLHHVLTEEAAPDIAKYGAHTHSLTSMLSSLAQLGDLTEDKKLLNRIHRFVQEELPAIALDNGWCTENLARTDMMGEMNNTTDILETCLILAKHIDSGYYARAERILRGHLLPSQWLADGIFTNAKQAARGAFGFPTPWGYWDIGADSLSFNWDVTGGSVGGLCEAYRVCVTPFAQRGLSVNLLFDWNGPVTVKSPYGNDDIMTVENPSGLPVRVRIPGNCDPSAIRVNGLPASHDGKWLYLDDSPGLSSIALSLNKKMSTEEWKGRTIAFLWEGERVCCANNGQRTLCFFRSMA